MSDAVPTPLTNEVDGRNREPLTSRAPDSSRLWQRPYSRGRRRRSERGRLLDAAPSHRRAWSLSRLGEAVMRQSARSGVYLI
jgi:hypothetical protein